MKNLIYISLMREAQAKKAEAVAILHTYMNKSVGIGEHPQIIEEAVKYLDQLAAAQDRIETLQNFFDENGEFKHGTVLTTI
jgi:hypothetical protein